MHKKMLLPYTGDEPYIFVSYNKSDKDIVYKIIIALQERGYRFWYNDGPIGNRFREGLKNRIQQCEILFCFLSQDYQASSDCKWEIKCAVDEKKKIIPVVINNFAISLEMKSITASHECIYLKGLPTETGLVDFLCDNEEFKDILNKCLSLEEKPVDQPGSEINPGLPAKEKPEDQPGSEINPGLPAKEKPEDQPGSEINPGLPAKEKPEDQPGGEINTGLPAKEKPVDQSPKEDEDNKRTDRIKSTFKHFCEKKITRVMGVIISSVLTIALIAGFMNWLMTPNQGPELPEIPEIPVVDREHIIESGKKAKNYLAALTEKDRPLPVYDPEGAEEDEKYFLYDNAIAALALLSESNTQNSRFDNGSDNLSKQILDAIIEFESNDDNLIEGWDSKSLAAAAIAFLQYDKSDTFTPYIYAAQRLLNHVAENRRRDDVGFSSFDGTEGGTTEENLWLYAAFDMLYKKTGNIPYSQSADHALAFVQKMRSKEEYYLTGESRKNRVDTERVSSQVQALAVLILDNRTDMQTALSLQESGGGFLPDNRSSGGFGTECTALMSLACGKLGMDEKKEQALSAVYYCKLDNGSIPAGSSDSLSDGTGKRYPYVSKTSATAWYAMAAAEYNPFEY